MFPHNPVKDSPLVLSLEKTELVTVIQKLPGANRQTKSLSLK